VQAVRVAQEHTAVVVQAAVLAPAVAMAEVAVPVRPAVVVEVMEAVVTAEEVAAPAEVTAEVAVLAQVADPPVEVPDVAKQQYIINKVANNHLIYCICAYAHALLVRS